MLRIDFFGNKILFSQMHNNLFIHDVETPAPYLRKKGITLIKGHFFLEYIASFFNTVVFRISKIKISHISSPLFKVT